MNVISESNHMNVGHKLVATPPRYWSPFLRDPESRQEPPTSPQEIRHKSQQAHNRSHESPTSAPKWMTNWNFIMILCICDIPGELRPPGVSEIAKSSMKLQFLIHLDALVGISRVSCGLVGILGGSLAGLWRVLDGIPGPFSRSCDYRREQSYCTSSGYDSKTS
jgi:hypothetical protein